jgi:VWFA-related protein
VERNLVQVRVVVRDSKGHALGDLHQDDFQVFDNGKPQVISHFAVEIPQAAKPAPAPHPPGQSQPEPESEEEAIRKAPRRYLGLYVDDIHMPFEDLALVRRAAEEYLKSALTPGDRVGLFTASGQGNLDFTGDWDALDTAFERLQSRQAPRELHVCPEVLDYQSYLIMDQHDQQAEDIATYETLHCRYDDDPRFLVNAHAEALSAAERQLLNSERSTEDSLRGLDEVIRRMSVLPGQRSLVVVSPGFLTISNRDRVDRIADRALRANVVINALDSKGLFAPMPGGDMSREPNLIPKHADLMGQKSQLEITGHKLEEEVLQDLPMDTGGVFFTNSNNLKEGFQRVSELPEAYYTLAFSPAKLKFDGRYHQIQVKLVHSAGLTVEARRGYFAPKASENAQSRVKEQIIAAVFSQEKLNQIPIEVHTQFFKQDALDATLSILARVDLRVLQFRKAEGRNLNNLTVVTALFDQNGNYLQGKEKHVDFRLRDASLEQLSRTGLTMKTSFNVKPGTYLIREVVRDSEGSRISGLTRAVEIPY